MLPPMILRIVVVGQAVQLVDVASGIGQALDVREVRTEDDVVGAEQLDQARWGPPRGTGASRSSA